MISISFDLLLTKIWNKLSKILPLLGHNFYITHQYRSKYNENMKFWMKRMPSATSNGKKRRKYWKKTSILNEQRHEEMKGKIYIKSISIRILNDMTKLCMITSNIQCIVHLPISFVWAYTRSEYILGSSIWWFLLLLLFWVENSVFSSFKWIQFTTHHSICDRFNNTHSQTIPIE